MDWTRLKVIDERDETPRRPIQNPDREPEAVAADRAAELTGGAILHLQRAAGNDAVTELLAQGPALQRQPADAPAPTQEKEPSRGGSPSPTISPFHWGPGWGPHEAKASETESAEKADVKKTPYTSPAVSTLHHLFDSQVVGNLFKAYISLGSKVPMLDNAQNYLHEAWASLEQLRQPYADVAVRAEMLAAEDLIVQAERLISEHAAKQLIDVETIQMTLNADGAPIGPRLVTLREAIFRASDPVESALHGQLEAVKALMNIFDHSVVDNVRNAHKALDPPNPDFHQAIGHLVQAGTALGGMGKDHEHDAVLTAEVQLVKDLVDSSRDLVHEHWFKDKTPIAGIAAMIHPVESDLAKRLKAARAALH